MSANLTITAKIVGVGAWGTGFSHWSQLSALLVNEGEPGEPLAGPKPEIIPANERRRAPLPVRLAVESSSQAVSSAQMTPEDFACVFGSGLGDTQLTDYMCAALAGEHKQLSPTKFHNSVHNAAAGYWTISTGCMQNANSIAGFDYTVPLALMEAVSQCQQQSLPVLMTVFDAPVTPVLTDILGEGTAFASSLALVPVSFEQSGTLIEISIHHESSLWPELPTHFDVLSDHYQHNPSARLLPLLAGLAHLDSKQASLLMPLSEALSLSIRLTSEG